MPSRKQRGDPFEQPRLVRHVDIQLDVINTQQLANGIHFANLFASDTVGLVSALLKARLLSSSSSLSLAW